jgi:integrase
VPGSIRQRAGRGRDVWELRVYLGRDGRGRIRHQSVTFRGSKKAAEKELVRLLAYQDRKPALVPDDDSRTWGPRTTVNDAIEGWRANGWDDLSPTTVRRYENNWKVHIKDSIGKRQIATLGAYEVERYYRGLKAEGLAEASVRQIRAILHRSCRLARKWSGGTLPNPIAGTELPDWTLAERGPEVRSPTVDEVRSLLKAARDYDTRISALIRFVAATGVRRGEVCAVRWEDIDWDKALVRVDESIVADVDGARVKAPKTRASIRPVAVDQGTLAELRELRSEQEALATASGETVRPRAFVFSTEPSGLAPPHPDGASHAFRTVQARAGVAADIHLHSLRHFQSTQLDTVLSEAQKQARLGWATVHMARHYTDALSAEDRRAADHMGGVLG